MVFTFLLQKIRAEIQSPIQRKKDEGFALVLLVYFIPILLALFIACSALAQLSNEYLQRHRHCRLIAFQAMSKIEVTLNALLKKNKHALSLRRREGSSRLKWRVALVTQNYVLAARYKAKWLQIRAQRITLDQWQQEHIHQMNVELEQARRHLQSMKNTRNKVSRPQLVLNRDSLDIAPQYFPAPMFSERATLSSRYEFALANAFPQTLWILIQKIIPQNGSNKIRSHCAARLQQQGHVWRARLTKNLRN